MHILFVPSWFPQSPTDTAGSFFREQAQALRRHGENVGVLAPSELPIQHSLYPQQNFHGDVEDGIPVLRFDTLHPFPRTLRANSWASQPSLRKALASYIRAWGKPDVLHAHSLFPAAYYCDFLSKEYGIPFVYTEHRSLMHLPRSKRSLQEQRWVTERAAARIGVSRGHSEHLANRLEMHPQQWKTIANVLPAIAEHSFPQPHLDSSCPFTIGHLSVLDPVKNVASLVRAFTNSFSKQDHVRLVIAGDGEDRVRLQEMVHNFGRSHQVDFLGQLRRDEVAQFCASLDVFVLPSISESFGVVLMEALSQGTPVIATKTWGGEFIVGAEDGELVPVGDDDELAMALIRARASRPDRAERETRRARTIDRFGERRFVESYRRVYLEAIG